MTYYQTQLNMLSFLSGLTVIDSNSFTKFESSKDKKPLKTLYKDVSVNNTQVIAIQTDYVHPFIRDLERQADIKKELLKEKVIDKHVKRPRDKT
uniref:hypothetical protein n=1 Tax=Salmonella sp. s51228 TaxID=3159652 RepID=UPI0039807AB9